ncbi:hypothetical protein LshimejAT787_1602510 [Lyophyllum shimeji]|uniref:Uncharacterized protein n=1 Tax=Lyophyllum shimeji TaxID=47721 RepID=A0A9P3UVN2_LYOSH|nr:hypothetical protein LshimejAT787_1602510 [Lyophyllum shimeji]
MAKPEVLETGNEPRPTVQLPRLPSRTTLPTDIWLYIATRFIPSKTLCDLYSVNSLFLDLALNERYKVVSFLEVDQKTAPFLEHLRDANLSSRVRRLRVNPVWFTLDPHPRPKISLRTIISCAPSFGLGRWADVTRKDTEDLKKRKYIDTLSADLVLQFTNVTSFVLVTRYWPHPRSLALFLTNSWRAFGLNLRRLTINAPLNGFAALLPPPSELVALEELTLRFSTDLTTDDRAVDTRILTEIISPFLREVSPKLKTFSLMSSALGDHSVLFNSLDYTPCLTTLSLNIGFYPPLLQHTSGLTNFVNRNAETLKHVMLQPLETFRSPSVGGSAYSYFAGWMTENASNDSFLSNIQTLVVLPSTDSSTRLDAMMTCIPRSKDTLMNLILGERCMSFAELNTLVANFSHRPGDQGLKILHVQLISLNPQVFDLLAEKLIGLEDLDVKFNLLLPDVRDESPRPLADEEPTEEVIAEFLGEMAKRSYSKWRLYSLWIWQRSHMTTKTAHEILAALKPSIPSVRVMDRMDHTHHLHTLFS